MRFKVIILSLIIIELCLQYEGLLIKQKIILEKFPKIVLSFELIKRKQNIFDKSRKYSVKGFFLSVILPTFIREIKIFGKLFVYLFMKFHIEVKYFKWWKISHSNHYESSNFPLLVALSQPVQETLYFVDQLGKILFTHCLLLFYSLKPICIRKYNLKLSFINHWNQVCMNCKNITFVRFAFLLIRKKKFFWEPINKTNCFLMI